MFENVSQSFICEANVTTKAIWEELHRILRLLLSSYLSSQGEKSCKHQKPKAADLYEGPLQSFGMNAVDRLFTPREVDELLALTAELAA